MINLVRVHVHSTHVSSVSFHADIQHPSYLLDIGLVEHFAYELVYQHDTPIELDIDDTWVPHDGSLGVCFYGTSYQCVLMAATMLAEFMMDLPSFKRFN